MPNKDRLKEQLRRIIGSSTTDAGCDRSGMSDRQSTAHDGGDSEGRRRRPVDPAEPVAQLKAMAAHHGLTLFDLSDTFDRLDPAKLEIAAWDDHPNALGHRRLFLALAPCNGQGPGTLPPAFHAHRRIENPKVSCGCLEYAADSYRRRSLDRQPKRSSPTCGGRFSEPDKVVIRDEANSFSFKGETGSTPMEVRHLSECWQNRSPGRPDHPAVEDEHGRQLSYAALERDADRLATRLAPLGVDRGDRVGSGCRRVSRPYPIHGILRTGTSYVPVDPTGPAIRAASILESSGVKAAIIAAELAPLFEQLGPSAAPRLA